MQTDGPVLTAAQTRAAEQRLFDSGMPVIDLMEKAGRAVADAIIARFEPADTLVLCGTGNNGGDGYVVARLLKEAGWDVRIAATGGPRTDAAMAARQRWGWVSEPIEVAEPASLVVDALFGIGLTRPLDSALAELLGALVGAAQHKVAIDLPSGVQADDGSLFGNVPQFDLTVALGAWKPAHRTDPAAARCGEIMLADIGLF